MMDLLLSFFVDSSSWKTAWAVVFVGALIAVIGCVVSWLFQVCFPGPVTYGRSLVVSLGVLCLVTLLHPIDNSGDLGPPLFVRLVINFFDRPFVFWFLWLIAGLFVLAGMFAIIRRPVGNVSRVSRFGYRLLGAGWMYFGICVFMPSLMPVWVWAMTARWIDENGMSGGVVWIRADEQYLSDAWHSAPVARAMFEYKFLRDKRNFGLQDPTAARALEEGWPVGHPIVVPFNKPSIALLESRYEVGLQLEFLDSREAGRGWQRVHQPMYVRKPEDLLVLPPSHEAEAFELSLRVSLGGKVRSEFGPYTIKVSGELDDFIEPVGQQAIGPVERLLQHRADDQRRDDEHPLHGVYLESSPNDQDEGEWWGPYFGLYLWWQEWRGRLPATEAVAYSAELYDGEQLLAQNRRMRGLTNNFETTADSWNYADRVLEEGVTFESLPDVMIIDIQANRSFALPHRGISRAWEGRIRARMERQPNPEWDGRVFWYPTEVEIIR